MNKPIKVEKETGQRDEQGRPITVLDQELTAAAMQKADEIKQAFTDWIWTDDDRRASLSRLYNDRFNTNVPPRYDGSHLELVGASSEVKLRPHQKDAVWRAIQEGTALFDHVVGAGKTMACIATIMESKRTRPTSPNRTGNGFFPVLRPETGTPLSSRTAPSVKSTCLTTFSGRF